MVVDPNRVRALQALLNSYECDVILSDDGLQHTALGRDIEIIVVDGKRHFGNGCCLPAGPLREPLSRLKTVDFVIQCSKGPTTSLLCESYFNVYLVPGEPYNLLQPEKKFSLDEAPQQLHAVTGIGNPQPFFDQLRRMGLSIIEHPLPDHHRYTPKDIDFGPDSIVFMTEKDAVKCEPFAKSNHWCLPVLVDCDSMLPHLLALVQKARRAKTLGQKRRVRHGKNT